MHSIAEDKNGEPNFRVIDLWPLLIPLLLILPNLGAFPFPGSQAQYSDLAVAHYPNAIFLRRALFEYHTIPLWSPSILSGYPFFADPISGLHYPPGWLAVILPLPLAFNLLVALHFLWGGIGMYKLGRIQGFSHGAALLSALAFESLPKMFAHYGAGHLTLMYAVPWTSWLLYFAIKSKSTSRWSPVESVILAMIFLADPRWAPYAGILWLSYEVFIGFTLVSWKFRARMFRWFVSQIALCGLLVAPLALPLLEYTKLSTRASLVLEDVLAFSFPPLQVIGLLYPNFGGFHEWVIYPGAVVLVLSIVGLLGGLSNKKVIYWGLVALVSLVFAVGIYLPFGRMLAHIPGLDLLRVPARALFIFGMAFTMLAGSGLDYFLAERYRRRIGFALACIGVFAGVLTLGIVILSKRMEPNIVWGGLAIVLTVLWIMVGRRWLGNTADSSNRVPAYWFTLLTIFLLIDLGWTSATLLDFRSTESVFTEGVQAASYLEQRPGLFRVYSPSYSISQTTAARANLDLADGVHPMQIAAYTKYMDRASGVPRNGYSVTIPPYASGDPSTDNQDYMPDVQLLGLLNVGYLVSEFELNSENLTLLRQFGETRVYQNEVAHERAWVLRDKSASSESIKSVNRIEWSPNRIVVEAQGAGLLVLSEINYPGWTATVNGFRRPIQVANDILRAVALEGAMNQVVFSFRPPSLYIGVGLALLGLIGLGIMQFKRETPS